MNILQILPELNVGGVETGTVDLVKYLVKAGHKAVVVSNGGALVKEVESCGGIHYRLPVHKKSIFTIARLVRQLSGIIKKENIDIVHARSRVPAWIAYFACRRRGVVFITTCHGYYKNGPFSQVMSWGKRVIVLSNVIARHMIEDFDTPHERIRLVPRSVDLEKFRYLSPDEKRKKEFNVGIIGRITPIKGHLHFIKAMARVARAVPGLKLWIVGDAPASREAYKEQVQVLTKRLGLWHCTDFLGTQRDIPAILAQLDLLVLATTTHEAFGRVIIEAHAAGVPVIATKVGGVVDVIEDGKTGLLVAPADVQSMAEAAIRLFNDPGLCRMLAENAYAKVRAQYNVELMVDRTLDVYRDAISNFRILIIKFSSVGDVILSIPSLRALRDKFLVGYKISFLVGDDAKEVLLRSPYIDELLVCNFKGKNRGLRGLLKLGYQLRKKNFDIVIDLQNNRKSHILSRLTLAPASYGYDNKKFSFLLKSRIKDDRPAIDPVTHQFAILKMLGIELQDPHLELWPSEDDSRYVEGLLESGWINPAQKLIGISISASPRWLTKAWPLSYIARLCEELSRRDMRVVITGTEKDKGQAERLLAMLEGSRPLDACGKTTVNQLACLIKKCSAYVCCDSAPLHIAAAMGIPFVALFGPTDPRRHLPPARDYVVINRQLDCQPCYKSKCKHRKCMELIKPEEVLKALDKLLGQVK